MWQEVPQGGRIFPASGGEARSGGMSRTTAEIIKEDATLAGRTTGSDAVCLHKRGLQKVSIKVQVLNTAVVAMCMPYRDA
jgi:hypothetical protein